MQHSNTPEKTDRVEMNGQIRHYLIMMEMCYLHWRLLEILKEINEIKNHVEKGRAEAKSGKSYQTGD